MTLPSHAFEVEQVRRRLEAGNGGYEVVHASPGLEVGVYVLVAPEPDHQQPHADDEVYVVLEGSGVLDVVEHDAAAAGPTRTAATPAMTGHLNLITLLTQWSATPCDSASSLARRRDRALSEQMRSPTSPSSAGSRLRAMSTARATVDAATRAIVDNVGEEDWTDVTLSLVSGTPVSFVQRLQQPYYRHRPVVPIPGDVQLAPQGHEAAISSSESVTVTSGGQVRDLPLSGRNPMAMAPLQPGSTNGAPLNNNVSIQGQIAHSGGRFHPSLDAPVVSEATGVAAAASGVELTVKAELDGIRLIASLAMGGFGAAILPATAIPTWLQGDWSVVPVSDLPPRRVGVAQRRRGLPSPAARALLAVIREAVVPGPDVPLGVNEPR